MQVVAIDLTKDPEIAALLADKEPGAKVYACFTVKSRDEQTAHLRLAEITDDVSELSKPGEGDDSEETDGAEPDDGEGDATPEPAAAASSAGQRMAAMMSGGSGVDRQG